MKTTLAVIWLVLQGVVLPANADEKRALVPSITVVGTGEASAKPDTGEIHVGVVTQDASAAKALEQNNEAMSKLFKKLDAKGIGEKDRQTSNFSIIPQRHREPQGEELSRIAGYQVNNQVRIKVRKLDSLGETLDELVREGANQIHGISFSVADSKKVLDDARREAMADARRKAELYARAASVKLGRVLLIQEQTPHVLQPMFVGMMERAAPGGVPVASGEQQFQAHITITYAIE